MTDSHVCHIGFRAPLDWPALMQFLAARAIDGVELIQEGVYRRTLRIHCDEEERVGWIELHPTAEGQTLTLRICESLAPVSAQVLAKIEHLVDAHCDPSQVAAHLGAIARARPGLRVPGAVDGFELAVRAILGQQITVKAARTLAGRFAQRFGEPLAAPDLRWLFPRPAELARRRLDTIAKLGILASRAQAIIGIARAMVSGELALHPGADVQATLRSLTAIRGVGQWTAHYIAMRALGWRDAFPAADLALLKAMGAPSPKAALVTAESWRPLRAYAVMHLWKSLDA